MSFKVKHGDCVDLLRDFTGSSFDAVVTDPPYEIGFMGQRWDGSGVAFDPDTWAEVMRVMKPGAYLLAFGGARTHHRLAVAIEDGGFEIRDTIMWLYASGFPKSMDVGKAFDKAAGADREVIGRRTHPTLRGPAKVKSRAYHVESLGSEQDAESWPITAPATDEAKRWDGWGTALKPAHEPIIVARRPLEGTIIENFRRWGTGGINIRGSLIPFIGEDDLPAGRWPANLALDDAAGELLDKLSGIRPGGGYPVKRGDNAIFNPSSGGEDGPRSMGDSGGASRFFFSGKVGRLERDLGLEDFEKKMLRWSSGDQSPGTFQSDGTDRYAHNLHPTVKPIELMRWLIGLVTPPAGRLLDPFCGSGSTGCAAVLDGIDFTGIEKVKEFHEVALQRIKTWQSCEGSKVEDVLRSASAERLVRSAGQVGLFD